ncbi:MAG: cell division protein FtsB [Burkholderiales bacterium]|nr:cell division protein FtsB [Burkholderiales bacterium]
MRLLAVFLAVCIVLLQWPLWIGKGSWLKVWQIESQVSEQKKQNDKLAARNAAMDAEVRDLKTGTDAIEERARNELGMIRADEVFFQILDGRNSTPSPTTIPAVSGPAAVKPTESGPSAVPLDAAKPAAPLMSAH